MPAEHRATLQGQHEAVDRGKAAVLKTGMAADASALVNAVAANAEFEDAALRGPHRPAHTALVAGLRAIVEPALLRGPGSLLTSEETAALVHLVEGHEDMDCATFEVRASCTRHASHTYVIRSQSHPQCCGLFSN